MMAIRIRYRTGWPYRVAGLNVQAFAAAISMRSWNLCMGDINFNCSTSPEALTVTSK
jgi:hypothetical protein